MQPVPRVPMVPLLRACRLVLRGLRARAEPRHFEGLTMLHDKHGAPLTSKRIRTIRGARHPSAVESGTPCAARRDKYDNFTGSLGKGYCGFCGLPRALHA